MLVGFGGYNGAPQATTIVADTRTLLAEPATACAAAPAAGSAATSAAAAEIGAVGPLTRSETVLTDNAPTSKQQINGPLQLLDEVTLRLDFSVKNANAYGRKVLRRRKS